MNRTNIPLLHTTLCLCAAWLLCTTTACDDWIETTTALPEDGETVEVTVRLGFAPEENAADAATDTRTYAGADKGQAFSAKLQKKAETREITEGTEATTPDGLYELNVMQFKADGTSLLTTSTYKSGKTDLGSVLSISLAASEDCQLVIIARGEGASTAAIGTTTISALQAISFDRDVIATIPTSGATQDEMNKMPYVLHLKHVKVVKDGNVGKLQSPDVNSDNGAQDVRLMLKRLAAKVTVNWNYGVTVNTEEYTLKQLLLQSVPLKFNYIPAPNKDDGSYPDVMDQYTTLTVKNDYSVSGNQTNGSYSFWVPANVRADNPAVSSALLRTKDNAPAGSSYLTFEAANNKNVNKKFRYRLYIGDDNSQNFSIRQNTDYIYNIDFKHTGIPTQDRRVTYVDPIPASQNNDNFVPTANCFMVKPGGSFCFDPFTFRSGGKDIDNDVLAGWITAGTATRATGDYGIQYVKLLWQTKEEGDLGEPVMGIVNSETDHSNIVEIKPADGNTNLDPASYAFTAANQCRIYCRVAPGTTGGSGLIAAYDTEGQILWSWHVWVTDYSPDVTGKDENFNDPNKRKLKLDYNTATQSNPPMMMDRNLGAMAGYVVTKSNGQFSVNLSTLEKSKTNGFHYQWGRKDPFPSSYTSKKIGSGSIALPDNVTKPIEGLLNLYKADGVTYLPFSRKSAPTTYRVAYQNPQSMYKKPLGGSDEKSWMQTNALGVDAWYSNGAKTVHDPSPAGWRVAQSSECLSFLSNKDATLSWSSNVIKGLDIKNQDSKVADEGVLVSYDTNSEHCTYIHYMGYMAGTNFTNIGRNFLLWTSSKRQYDGGVHFIKDTYNWSTGEGCFQSNGYEQEAIPLRCVQESGD